MWMQRVRISYGAGFYSCPLEAPRGSGAVLMRFSADWQLTWFRRVGLSVDNCKRIQLLVATKVNVGHGRIQKMESSRRCSCCLHSAILGNRFTTFHDTSLPYGKYLCNNLMERCRKYNLNKRITYRRIHLNESRLFSR